jgi:hypothetical protein
MECSNENENKISTKNATSKISQLCSYEKIVKDHPNFETKTNKVPKNEEKKMKMNLQNLHVQKIKWKHHGKIGFLC